MMIKIVTLFLIFMAVLAMFGRLRLPKIGGRDASRKPNRLPKPRLCHKCGKYQLKGETCPDCPEDKGRK
jgi:hypothetical protein